MSRLDIPKIPAASNTPDERITSVSAVTLFLNSLPAENRGSASPLNAFEPSEVLGMSSRNKGFTIIELMISTVIFSLVLLMCLVGIVQVSRTYYKGVTRAKTQEATRRLMDEIKESIQLSGVKILPTTGPAGPEVFTTDTSNGIGTLCVGNKLYSYAIDRMNTGVVNSDANKKEIKNALISDDTLCAPGVAAQPLNSNSPLTGTQRSLLENNMRLTKFAVVQVSPELPGLWQVDISIAYGAQDLLRYTDDTGVGRVVCANNTGAEFCSIAELSTIVTRRISNATN